MNSRAGTMGLEIFGTVALLVAWWLLSSGNTDPFYPSLERILERFNDLYLFSLFESDVLPSVWHFAAGVTIAAVLGVTIGLLLGLSPGSRHALSPILEFFRAMPVVALAPAALVALGVGAKYEITLIAFACVWPVLLNAIDGVRSVEPIATETASVYGLSPRRQVRTVVIPAMMPQVFAGLRVALAAGTALMVLSNMLGATSGVGFQVIVAQETYDIPAAWAGIIVIGSIGVIANLVLVGLQAYFLSWHRGWRASASTQT